jgi:hypothetical protein
MIDKAKLSRRLLIAGGLLMFAVSLVKIIAMYYALQTVISSIGIPSHYPYYSVLAQNISDFYAGLAAFGIIASLLFISLIISSARIKTENQERAVKWSKIAFVVAISFVVIEVSLPQMIFDNASFAYSLLSPTASFSGTVSAIANYGGEYGSTQFLTILSGASLIFLCAGLLGGLLAALGAAYGFGIQNKGYAIKVISVTVILVVALSFLSLYLVNRDNNASLAQLNQKINENGAGFRYLLSNYTLYNATIGYTASPISPKGSLYSELLAAASPNLSLSSALAGSGESSASLTQSELDQIDWGAYNPFVRVAEIGATWSVGIPVNINDFGRVLSINGSPLEYLVAPHASTLQSLYEVLSSGEQLLLWAVDLGKAFQCDIFSPYKSVPTSGQYSISMPVADISTDFLGTTSLTSMLSLTNASILGTLGQLPIGYLALILDGNGFQRSLNKGYFQCSQSVAPNSNVTVNTTRLTTKQFFYMFSLPQYGAYEYQQILYNKTFGPSIEFVGYTGNYFIVNLGNLNLTDNKPIKLYVDDRGTNFTRYYNYLLSSNTVYGVGFHNLTVSIGNAKPLSDSFYVSPFIPASTEDNGNGMSITLWNPSNAGIRISNPTAITNPGYPQVITYGFYNASYSWARTSNLTLTGASNMSYIQNGTGFAKQASAARIPLSALSNYTLGANKTLGLVYTSAQSCQIGQSIVYYFVMNTSRGQDFQVFLSKCT